MGCCIWQSPIYWIIPNSIQKVTKCWNLRMPQLSSLYIVINVKYIFINKRISCINCLFCMLMFFFKKWNVVLNGFIMVEKSYWCVVSLIAEIKIKSNLSLYFLLGCFYIFQETAIKTKAAYETVWEVLMLA